MRLRPDTDFTLILSSAERCPPLTTRDAALVAGALSPLALCAVTRIFNLCPRSPATGL